MPKHGFFDKITRKWFCGYFMDKEEWLDIHDYSPDNPVESSDKTNKTEESNIMEKH
ncbi:MAG: hypothetical protein ACPKPY_12360 [Nitrososphaeraceae archaeon]